MNNQMSVTQALELVRSELHNVEKALVNLIDTKIPIIKEVSSYLFSGGGKRLRPTFLCLIAGMYGYKGDKTAYLSAVIEYIHTATLLHDDIVDGAKFRRNKPSANVVYGNDVVVLCGDFLYSRAYTLLTDYGDKFIQKTISEAALAMSEGELIQLSKTADINFTMDDYIQIICRKTAILFSAACMTGGRIAGANDSEIAELNNFGYFLGLAFQMTDDIMDYLGNSESMGKKPGTDLYEGKLTLPIILLLEKCNADEKKGIETIFKKETRTEADLVYILKLLQAYGIKELAEVIVNEYVEKSLSSLNIFPNNLYKKGLIAIASNLVGREN